MITTIDIFVIHDAAPFGLSLSKPFDKLSPNGSKVPVTIYESLNKLFIRHRFVIPAKAGIHGSPVLDLRLRGNDGSPIELAISDDTVRAVVSYGNINNAQHEYFPRRPPK